MLVECRTERRMELSLLANKEFFRINRLRAGYGVQNSGGLRLRPLLANSEL